MSSLGKFYKERPRDAKRPTKEDTFMELARVWAKRSTCSSRIAVGTVLVNSMGQVISSGYNGSARGLQHCDEVGCVLDSDDHCLNAVHSEENCILQSAFTGVSTKGATMYVTHSPCLRCAQRIIQAGISEVVYAEEYKDASTVKNLLQSVNIKIRLLK